MAQTESSSAKHAARIKIKVALSSVGAALLLTGLKLGVGLWSNSLGLLSEAAHSGLDLLAALLTLYAVCVAVRPPDQSFQYGHSKMENLSAVLQSLLLMLTCAWIIYEAIDRLFFSEAVVDANIWSVFVLIFCIAVDYSRARLLNRTARLFNSQALEADAMHFSTDVWSSLVVLLGLGGIWLAGFWPAESKIHGWLLHADSLAALLVALMVLVVSLRLGLRGIGILLDRAPSGLSSLLQQAVASVPEVLSIKRLRVRQSGPQIFIDMNLSVSRNATLERSHRVAYLAERAALSVAPGADIIIQIEPANDRARGLIGKIRVIAVRLGIKVHSVRTSLVRDQLLVELHAEVDDHLPIDAAHEQISRLEKEIQAETGEHCRIFTHIEPAGTMDESGPSSTISLEAIHQALAAMPEAIALVTDCHNIVLYDDPARPSLSFHCRFNPGKTVREVHEMTEDMEMYLRRIFPRLGRILIHAEPGRE